MEPFISKLDDWFKYHVIDFTISKLNSLTFWIRNNPEWVLSTLPILAILLSLLTLKTSFELSNMWKRRLKIRFASLLCGWMALLYFTVSGLYGPLDRLNSKFFAELKNKTNNEQPSHGPSVSTPKETVQNKPSNPKPKTSELKDKTNNEQSKHKSSFIFCILTVVVALLIRIPFKSEEKTKRFFLRENRHKYRNSPRIFIRCFIKSFLLVVTILFLCISSVSIVPNTNSSMCLSFIIGIAISASILSYQILNSSATLRSFQRPNEFESERITVKLIPIIVLFLGNFFALKQALNLISSTLFSGIISLSSFFLALLAYRGISLAKTHQQTLNHYSLVSLPIAIQSKNKKPLDDYRVYQAILKKCPQSIVYFESTSALSLRKKSLIKKHKAEIIVVNWEKYEQEEFEQKRAALNKTVIQAIRSLSSEIDILNFDIKDKEEEKNPPNKKFLNIEKVCQTIFEKCPQSQTNPEKKSALNKAVIQVENALASEIESITPIENPFRIKNWLPCIWKRILKPLLKWVKLTSWAARLRKSG